MPLETGTYISDLNVANPAGTDFLDKADDHLRLIKTTIKNTFPNISNAVTPTHTDLNKLTSSGSPQFSTVELGHASDTTLSRVSAGVVAVEGKNIALNGTGETLTTGTIELGNASDTTLSRVSAGVVAIEGTNIVKAGAITSSGLTQATSRLLGRTTASTGAIEELTAGNGLTLSGGSLVVNNGTGLGFSSGALVLNGPAFSVHKNGTDQTGVADNVATKVTWTIELFDTASCFDIATNHRFTPNVAGYYLIVGAVTITGTNPTVSYCAIYKNGSGACSGSFVNNDVGTATSVVSAVVNLNGTTDYVELYAASNVGSGTVTFKGTSTDTYFAGCFLRGE